MGKQGAELKWWDQSSSSTVLLDPAALVESCKQQIQGKDGIPAEHQRLIFVCRVDNQEVVSYICKRNSGCPRAEERATSDFLKELRSWEAILKDDNHAIAKLLHPLVAAEEQLAVEDEKKASRLSCQTARELRSMGIPCNVYYLFFDKWIPGSLKNGNCCKATSNLSIQIDTDFQARSFQILLFGRLNGSNLPLPFIYRMNGGEVAAQVSMQEQMLQYRQGQKTRHRLGLSTQSIGKGVEAGDVCPVVENIDPISGSNGIDDYYCPCGKDLEFTVLISNDRQLKCFVFKVIQVSGNASSKSKQLPSQISGSFKGGNPVSHCHTNTYCVSSSGVSCHKCETATRDRKITAAESLETTSCQVVEESLLPVKDCTPVESFSSSVHSASERLEPPGSDVRAKQLPGCLTTNGIESVPSLDEPMAKHVKKKKRKGKRSGKTAKENGNSTGSERVDSLSSECAVSGSVDSNACPAVVGDCEGCEEMSLACGTEGMDVSCGELNLTEQNSGKPFTGDAKCKFGLGPVPQLECWHSDAGMAKGCLSKPDESIKKGRALLSATSASLALSPDISTEKKSVSVIEENSKDCVRRSSILSPEGLPSCKSAPRSSGDVKLCESSGELKEAPGAGTHPDHTFTCPAACSQHIRASQPLVGPVLVDMAIGDSLPSATSSGVPDDSHFPVGDLVESFDSCDGKDHLSASDTNASARGGDNSSGAGSSNGRSGADGSDNRGRGRGSEEGNGTSGYHGGGEGSSGGSHGSGRGGSGTGGSSGGSGGGNGNRGGGRGRNGGIWDCCRFDEDGGNGGKEGDNDERFRNSFQAGSNGDSSRDFSLRKKGVCPLDQCSAHARTNSIGSVVGDQLPNGSSGSHGESAIGNTRSWQKPPRRSHEDSLSNPEDAAEESVAPGTSAAASDEEIPRRHGSFKSCPPGAPINGFLQNEENRVESRAGVDHYSRVRGLTQDSFAKVVKQKKAGYPHERNGDSHPSSSSRAAEESQSLGAIPFQDSSLKGAWQKKISWDDPRQPAFSTSVPEAALQVGTPNGRLNTRPAKNGTQGRSQPSTTEVSSPSGSSAPCTPNGSLDNFSLQELNGGHLPKQSEGTAQVGNLAFARMSAEGRLALDEASQRLSAWKGRRPPSGEQDRAQVRDKVVLDRERMTYSAQKWVPVENKNGGPGKGFGNQAKSLGTDRVGVDGGVAEGKESPHDSMSSKELASSDGDQSMDEALSSSSQSKVLRRPSLNVSGSEAETSEHKGSSSSNAGERPFRHIEHANLRGLLPREKTGSSSSKPTSRGTGSVVSELPRLATVQTMKTSFGKSPTMDVDTAPEVSPAEEESRKAVKAVLSAVQASCRDRRAAEDIAREVGYSMAEFEKVLGAVSPSLLADFDSNEMNRACCSGQERPVSSRERSVSPSSRGPEFSFCRCRVFDLPLSSFWRWYEEPSYYGAEVRAVDLQRTEKNEETEPFLAYFVPYLSAVQLFGFSSEGEARRFGGRKWKASRPPNIQSKASSVNNMLATLFPMEGKPDDPCSSQIRAACLSNEQKDGKASDWETPGIQLLYEFCEADLPQARQPLFVKVRELSKGICGHNSHSKGDPAVLERLCIGEVHPASWFAVAWYPIYRISEGPLRAVFLTYHSFDHFARRSSLSCLMGGHTSDVDDDSISLPVVGLECYNLQGEPWFTLGGRFSKEANKGSKGLSMNPSQCLDSRIASLHDVAAVMAKGIPDDELAPSTGGTTNPNKFRHADYEFFVKRRR